MFIFLKYFLLEGRGCESCTGRQEGGEDFIVEDFTVEGYVPSSLLQRQTGHAKLALLCCLWGRSYNVLYTSWGLIALLDLLSTMILDLEEQLKSHV